jgi:hypothetical protein
MRRPLFVIIGLALALQMSTMTSPALADDQSAQARIQEEIWALPLPLPMFAYVVRPVGDGPFPLVIMNHGVALQPRERGFFPLVEFRDAAMWFARRGHLVVAPVGSGYGAVAHDIPERGIYGPFFSKIGSCQNPNFRDAGLAVALVDTWIIDYMAAQKMGEPKNVIVVGQSAGGRPLLSRAEIHRRSEQSSPSLQAAGDGLTASRTTIVHLTDSSKPLANSAGPREFHPCGSTPRTIRSLVQHSQSGCTTPTQAPEDWRSIECFLHSAMKAIS